MAATMVRVTGCERLDLVRSAGWDVPRFVRAVADEMGCTCAVAIVSERGGFFHDPPCPARGKSPGYGSAQTDGFAPFDIAAVERVEARLRFVTRNMVGGGR